MTLWRYAARPLFEVVIPTTTPTERRLITAEQVRALIGSAEADDATLETLIDAACASAAAWCNLARHGATPPTLAREHCRATFVATSCPRGLELALPWRVPVTSVAVTEAGAELADADFRLYGSATLLRLSGGSPTCWSAGEIVVEYTAGWLVGVDASAYDGDTDPVPADLQQALIDQVRMQFAGRKRDPALRSENVPDVWSGAWNVAGGDSIGRSGLLPSLEAALGPYRALVVA